MMMIMGFNQHKSLAFELLIDCSSCHCQVLFVCYQIVWKCYGYYVRLDTTEQRSLIGTCNSFFYEINYGYRFFWATKWGTAFSFCSLAKKPPTILKAQESSYVSLMFPVREVTTLQWAPPIEKSKPQKNLNPKKYTSSFMGRGQISLQYELITLKDWACVKHMNEISKKN